jgi:hypothetical protein
VFIHVSFVERTAAMALSFYDCFGGFVAYQVKDK